MKLINLTPHPIKIATTNGFLEIPVSGEVARVEMTSESMPPILIDGIEVFVSNNFKGKIFGLPEPKVGIKYVVSAMVAMESTRDDLLCPGELIRDSKGFVVACSGLCTYW